MVRLIYPYPTTALQFSLCDQFSIFLLLISIPILVLSIIHIDSDIHTPTNISSTIPTPYSLPTKVYGSPSLFITIIGQLFRKENESIDPNRIIQDGKRVAENPYMDLYVVNDHLPVDIDWWKQESKPVYEYVRERLNTTLSSKVIVTFVPPRTGNCAPRGTTFHEQQSIIVIFANQQTDHGQVLATLAHELGHVFIQNKYENLSDVALTEGLATWAAGDYWESWKGVSFNSGVKDFIDSGTYLPLFSNFDMTRAYDNNSSKCIMNRDILLTETASFIDYLSLTYGVEKLSNLFNIKQPEVVNNQRVVYPPDFKEVFGLELNQLEYMWLKSINHPD
ncbi:MAG: hypothetical protein GYA36_16940 [Veillonellaceae bacterium]|nr:hypothetical protein [Veillonellaceae bacterium]